MKKPDISQWFKSAKTVMVKHQPEILTGFGIAGMITTTILAVKATPKALRSIEERKEEMETEKLPGVEIVKTTWKCYIPATVTGALSIACLISASKVNLKRRTALAAAYKLSETAFTEYKEKVVETIGEKKEKSVQDEVAKSRIEKEPISKNEVFVTGKGETLCWDYLSGRYFKSDIEQIRKVENILNKRMLSTDYISLNEFYGEVGLGVTKLGYELGWRLEDGLIEIYFSSQIAEDGTPCIVVEFENPPKYDYNKII